MAFGAVRVGHPEIDAQHEAIAQLVEDLRDAVERADLGGAQAEVEALWSASVSHFATEEALMEEHCYPERNPHRTAHHLFLEDLKALVQAIADRGLTEEVAGWAVRRVPEWIAFHVETNDVPLARYLARRAAPGAAAASPGSDVPRRRSDA
jgi:hemerythrin-like metal-binding protein